MVFSDPANLYDESYYQTGCGSPYERSPEWLQLFSGIADRIARGIGPATVLDAGCAMGFLVEDLRDRGVDAFGMDISEYAIQQVREDIRPYCTVGSLADPLPRRYDLIVCIEVLEHIPPEECDRAIDNLCATSDDILLSSSPDDFKEATHVNVQQPEYWASAFAERGFLRDVEFDASFVTTWAMRLRKRQEPLHRVIAPYERKLWNLSRQVTVMREMALETRTAAAQQEQTLKELADKVAVNDEAVATLHTEVAHRDEAIVALQTQMAEQDRVSQERLAQTELLAASAAAQLAERDQTLRTLEARVAAAEGPDADLRRAQQELADLSRERDSLAQRLVRIESRLTFRALDRLWQTQMQIAPPQTPHGKLWFAFTRSARRVIGQPPVSTETGTPPVSAALALPEEQYAPRDSYQSWARRCEELRYTPEKAAREIRAIAHRPIISIVMPVYNTPSEYLTKAIDSVRNQYYPDWELCISDDASPREEVRHILRRYAALDGRIKLTFSATNGGIGIASNQALALATGEFVGLLDHDDELTPDALYEVVAALQDNEADLLYSDEDKLDGRGQRCDPAFKPAWSPDLLLSCMYTSHFGVYRKAILDEIGGFRKGFDGSQDYDLALRFTERTTRIVHIPKILYHWRQLPGSAAVDTSAKPYAYDSARRALSEALHRRSVRGTVEGEAAPGFYRVRRRIATPGKVTIVIPTRDRLDLLRGCLEGITSVTEYENYEIVIVDNGSRDPATLEYLSQIPHRVLRDEGPFNFSRLNNLAVAGADGEHVLLLNDDTRPMASGWLSAMVEQAQRPEVGAVGAKLLYPNGRIQHAGVILGIGGVADHSHRFVQARDCGYFNFPHIIRDYSAVTGACLMIRRDLFLEIGGLDEEHLPVNFNDVDLCLRLREKGFLIVYTPYAVLEHRESASRKPAVDPREEAYMMAQWGAIIDRDPYYNPSLSVKDTGFSLDFAKPDSFFSMDWQNVSDAIVEPLYKGRGVGQEFISPRNGLCAVGVNFATYGKKCRGAVRFRLREVEASEDLRGIEVDAGTIVDNQLHIFPFAPIPDSAGKRFVFTIDFTPAVAGSEITIWKSSITDDAFGPYLERGSSAVGTLSFRSFTPAHSIAAPFVQCQASDKGFDKVAHLVGAQANQKT